MLTAKSLMAYCIVLEQLTQQGKMQMKYEAFKGNPVGAASDYRIAKKSHKAARLSMIAYQSSSSSTTAYP